MTTRAAVRKVADPEDIDWDGFDPGFSDFKDEVVAELKAAFLAAWKSSSVGDAVTVSRMNELATKYALERAGELIGGKFDVGQATIDYLREITAQAVTNGLSIGQLADALRHPQPDEGEELAVFSKDRATVIARTETATALGSAHRQVADETDQDEMSWDASGESSCEDCQGNEEDGWISTDDSFSSGDDNIPAHPNCTCVVTYRTKRLHEEDASRLPVVKEARCVQCHRKLGENVNAGARLHCPRCKCLTTVEARI